MNLQRCLIPRWALAVVAVSIAFVAAPAHAVTIDWVTVGDPGNAADTNPSGYGAVADSYKIGKYEVTIGQYTDFLNAAAKSDPYSLYNASMASDLNIAGISRAGSSGSYTYSVIGPSGTTPAGASSPGNRPITYVSWWDAARFANWMQNGQGSGSTETGAYTLAGATSGTAPARNPGAQFYIPTENEWYKAAFYKGSGTNAGYWDYATQSDTAPGNTIGSGANQANYQVGDYAVTGSTSWVSSQNYLTDVGAFTNSASFYGTFDQSGNVYEWNDLTGAAGMLRGMRGGYWSFNALSVSSSFRTATGAEYQDNAVGFRLAAPVPEPSTCAMALAGLGFTGYSMFRRRKRAYANKPTRGSFAVRFASQRRHGTIGLAILVACYSAIMGPARVSRAATIAYSILGSSNDFQGTIDVDDPAISIATFSNINFITATGFGSEPIGYYGTNSNGWVTYLGNNGGQFGFQSPTYYSAFNANTTWNGVIGNSYAITTGSGFDTRFSAPSSPSPNSITSQNGTITFSAVPEPSTYAMALAGIACGGYLVRRRRKHTSLEKDCSCRDDL